MESSAAASFIFSAVFPLGYITFVLIHAACLNFDSGIINFAGSGPHIYPYFFLNVDKVGVDGALMWVLILAVAFIAIGYIMFAIDALVLRKKKA